MPDVPLGEMDDIPLLGKAMAYGTIQGGDHRNVIDIGPNYWREMVRAYLACVSFADAPSNYEDQLEFIHPDDRGAVLECYEVADLTQSDFTIEYRVNSPSGHMVHVLESGQVELPGL